MWRFLNNIPRALKNYHGPRASVGVHVESDEKDQEAVVKQDRESQKCVAYTGNQNNCSVFNKDSDAWRRSILLRFLTQRTQTHIPGEETEENGTNRDEQQSWWNFYQKDFLAFIQGSNRILEAFTVGSSFLWSSKQSKKTRKSDLVYRVLFSICEKNVAKAVNGKNALSLDLPRHGNQPVLAIKDAAGSAHDQAINKSKAETLDAALKKFEQMCSDYTAQSESMLGIVANDKGEMSEAAAHFHTACMLGNKSACFNLGMCYEQGTGVRRDLEKAKCYYELAKDHVQAVYNLSLLYLEEEDLAANHGDRKKGIQLMEKAARLGLVQAQNYMGLYHMEETSNVKKAVSYFKASAQQNDCEGQYFLAMCHEHGLGVEVNECWAGHLYSLAANGGHDEAICNLARFNEFGLGGIPSDVEAANALYAKAARLGNEEAKNRLEEIRHRKHITEEQVSTSDRGDGPSSHTASLKNSSSFPNLRLINYRISDFFYEQLNRYLPSSTVFNPGGVEDRDLNATFYIGDRDIEADQDRILETEQSKIVPCDTVIGPRISGQCGSLLKSHTTSELSSLTACHV